MAATDGEFKIFITGDSGDDVYSWADEGNRSARPAVLNLPSDKARDAVVPSGAAFLKSVFNNFFDPASVVVWLEKTKPRDCNSILLESADHILTDIRPFNKIDRIERFIVLTRVDKSPRQEKQQNWLPLREPAAGSNNKLLVVHHGAAASKTGTTAATAVKTWLSHFVQPGRGRLQILVNVKQLPEIASWGEAGPVFESDFWNALLDDEVRNSVGLVVSLSALRRAGAAISFGLSWEQTLEDFGFELHCFPKLKALSYFRDVFVRVETVGLIHLKNPKNLGNADPEAHLYYEKYEKDRISRDPDRDGRIVGKNSLLLAALARLVCSKRPPDAKIEAAISQAIMCGIRAGIAMHNHGYDKNSFLQSEKALRLQKWAQPTKALICPSSKDADKISQGNDLKLPEIVRLQVPSWILVDPLKRGSARWHILNEVLAEAPIAPVNVALAVVAEGPYNVLNRKWNISDKTNANRNGPDERIEMILNRLDGAKTERKTSKKSFALTVPIVQFGKLIAVGRDESDEICGINNLFNLYIRERAHYDKPVSIAVFGPPGSGKSFAVKEIAETIDPKHESIEIMEYNLAQFRDSQELGNVLNKVGSINISGKTPLVFFDEFDCHFNETLGWLKFFLAPMQDGNFYGAAGTINIGRAMFVFAGGTNDDFNSFSSHPDFGSRKGPDFISRLRGHINIRRMDVDAKQQPPYMRRAITLRGLLEKHHFTRKTEDRGERATIDEAMIYALLNVGPEGYHHGVRSMEAILQMCATIDGHIQFGSLPSRAQLSMHVNADEFYASFLRGRARQSPYSLKLDKMFKEVERQALESAKSNRDISRGIFNVRRMLDTPLPATERIDWWKKLKGKVDSLEPLMADSKISRTKA